MILTSLLNSSTKKLTMTLSKSSPPSSVSPFVDLTSKTPFWISSTDISKVPPPKSYTAILWKNYKIEIPHFICSTQFTSHIVCWISKLSVIFFQQSSEMNWNIINNIQSFLLVGKEPITTVTTFLVACGAIAPQSSIDRWININK